MRIKRGLISFLMFVACLLQNSCSWGDGRPEAKITVKVVDEQGKPIEGARVGIGFYIGGEAKEKAVVGYSDNAGSFTGKANTFSDVGYSAKKDGYYKSYNGFQFKEKKGGKWSPWNPELTLVLRKIEAPVPMFAREVKIDIPEIGKAIGFDLIEYDWVSPYGKGIHSDFIFKLLKDFKSRSEFDSTLTVTFSNKLDGIQVVKNDFKSGSEFRLPRFAFEAGYQNTLKWYEKALPGKAIEDNFGKDNNYMFRIRSEEDNGKLKRAMYGKIHGEIRFDSINSKTATILFKYYLNPDYTRNLEFDPQRNLFTNLGTSERVGIE